MLGAYSALERQVALGNVTQYTRHEMLDVVKIDGKARGIIARDLVSGKTGKTFSVMLYLLCTGGYGNVFYLSTNAMGSNVTAAWKAHKQGASLATLALYTNSPDLYSCFWRSSVKTDIDVGVIKKRWKNLGA